MPWSRGVPSFSIVYIHSQTVMKSHPVPVVAKGRMPYAMKAFGRGNQSDLHIQCKESQGVDCDTPSYGYPRELILFDIVMMYRRTFAAYDGHSHLATCCSVDGPQPQALDILVVVPRTYHVTIFKVLSTVFARCCIEWCHALRKSNESLELNIIQHRSEHYLQCRPVD